MQQLQRYPSPYTAVPYRPAGVPPIRRAGKRLAILAGVIAGACALFGVGLYLYMKLAPQHDVLIDNGNDFAVDLELDGERFSLGPRASRTVHAGDGRLTVKATGPNGFAETASVELPRSSWSARGRTAVYNVGGKSSLAIVSVTYGTVLGAPEPIVALPPEPRLALLPFASYGPYGAIDSAFPEEVTASRGRGGVVLQRVCRIDHAARRVGCPGIKGLE